MPPGVTWLLPIHNGQAHLEQTLQSIAAQDYPNHKVLVWDDGSTDRTCEILSDWLGSRIEGRVVGHNRVGLGQALANLVTESDTELIARIDADDIAAPERLTQQVRLLIDNRRVGLVGSLMSVIGDSNHLITQPLDDASLRWGLRFGNTVNHPSVMLRRSAVMEVGNYRPLDAGKEDYDLWARLALIVRFATMPQTLTHYRLHSASATAGWSQENGEGFYEQRNGLIDRLLPGIPAHEGVRLLDLIRRPDDLGVTSNDLMHFRHAAMLAASACRYPATYFTQTDLFKQQYENLRTRHFKSRPLVRPVWPLLKAARQLIHKQSNKPQQKDAA